MAFAKSSAVILFAVPKNKNTSPDQGLVESNRNLYNTYTDELLVNSADVHAAAKAIGSHSIEHFAAMGLIEADLLRQHGLREDSALIDVGCGSGRLSHQLAGWLKGPYLGTDISPALLAHAEKACGRPDWRFEAVDGLQIPEQDAKADMVCFFSVLTHLRHEESFIYLEETRRVLKPGGVLVFSFLEFAVGSHWAVFDATVNSLRKSGGLPVNQFMSRDLIAAWAPQLGFEVTSVHRGDTPHIPLSDPAAVEGFSQVVDGESALGQSVAVLAAV